MARMHRRRKGASGSKRPFRASNPNWVMAAEDIERWVVKLAKDGYSTSTIGIILRDQYGVPSIKLATKKSVMAILKENGIKFELPEDLRTLMEKAVALNAHIQEHRKDLHNKRNLALIEAKIRRVAKYYVATKVLPKDWKYSIETAKVVVG